MRRLGMCGVGRWLLKGVDIVICLPTQVNRANERQHTKRHRHYQQEATPNRGRLAKAARLGERAFFLWWARGLTLPSDGAHGSCAPDVFRRFLRQPAAGGDDWATLILDTPCRGKIAAIVGFGGKSGQRIGVAQTLRRSDAHRWCRTLNVASMICGEGIRRIRVNILKISKWVIIRIVVIHRRLIGQIGLIPRCSGVPQHLAPPSRLALGRRYNRIHGMNGLLPAMRYRVLLYTSISVAKLTERLAKRPITSLYTKTPKACEVIHLFHPCQAA